MPPNHEKPQNKKEGVQKVFGTLDLFVSLLETEIKYPILQGGILPFWTPSHSESGKRDSNPRPPAWKASALSTELFPQTIIYSAITKDSLFLIPLG